jgi:hypothetical protein
LSAVVIHDGLAMGPRLRAPRRARRLAGAVLVVVWLLAGLTIGRAARSASDAEASVATVISAFCACVAALGVAVRSAGLTIDPDGVRWGWAAVGFRMRARALRVARVYRDAVALVPRRGFTSWYLGARDWAGFAGIGPALRRAGLAVEEHPGPAPILAKLQSYGFTLDLILFLDVAAQTGLFLLIR